MNVTTTFPYWTIIVVPIHWQHDFTCFCTLRHYVIVNLNFHENHVQYVHSKTDDPPRVTHYTVQEFSYRKHKNWGKKSLKINDGTSAWNDVNDIWATWESHRYAYRCHVGKRRYSAFPTPRIDNKSTTEQISANWERRGPTQIRQTA